MLLLGLLAVAGLAWWLHSQNLLLPNLLRLGVTAAGLLLAIRLMSGGKMIAGLVALFATWAWWRLQQARRPVDPLAEARALLNVRPDADAAAINAAWRLAMARAHPDVGGTDADVQALTDAREALLTAMRRNH